MSEASEESQPSTLPAESLRSKVKEVVSLNIHDEDLHFALMQLSKLEESRIPSGVPQKDKEIEGKGDDTRGGREPFGRVDVRVREMLEESNLHSYDMFLNAFSSFMEDFSHVQKDIETLGRSCAKMQDSISTTRERSKEALRLFDAVKNRSDFLEGQVGLASAFLDRFFLSEDERETLLRGTVDLPFLQLFWKVQHLRKETKRLMRGDGGNVWSSGGGIQRTGVELREQLGKLHDQAVEITFHFAQAKVRQLTEDSIDAEPFLAPALWILRNYSFIVFEVCVQEMMDRLGKWILSEFLDALSTGGRGDRHGPPIDLHAHDPVRYVGDILAWVHQEVVIFKEHLRGLFIEKLRFQDFDGMYRREKGEVDAHTYPSGRWLEEDEWFIAEDDDRDRTEVKMDEIMAKVMDAAFDGVSRQLRVRLGQIMEAQTSFLSLFQLGNVITFYSKTLGDLLVREQAPLVQCVMQLGHNYHDHLLGILRQRADRMILQVPSCPLDLSIPESIGDGIHMLERLILIYEKDTFIPSSEDVASQFEPILASFVDPLQKLCLACSEGLPGKGDSHIFLINCFESLHSVLSRHDVTVSRSAQVSLHLESEVKMFVEIQGKAILDECGIPQQIQKLKDLERTLSSSSLLEREKEEGMEEEGEEETSIQSLTRSVQSFYSFLFQLGSSQIVPKFDFILSSTIREQIRSALCRIIGEKYEELYTLAFKHADALSVEHLEDILYHSPQQVRQLLQ
eukprot:TRINITY_DN1144_c0_g2_i1.p1 TRINITY_DN1144_c0_g2~~TRINITY_DN1144_c0_g2_i1.p1  ORF type:complete len:736 (+),score=231.22 TRINITY_DN1144_c0_g2_i1:102-2309(+)